MKKLSSFTILFLFFLLVTNCKKDDSGTDEVISGKTEYSGKVNVDNAEVTVGIPDVVDVKIPQGAFSGDATFTVKVLNTSSLPAPTDFTMYEAFEITSSSGSTFAKNLEIKIKYDDTKGEKIAKNNGAAFYNETSKKWIPFNNVVVDTIQKIVTINTNHLTKLGKYSYSYKVLGYTDWASSSHFYIYWTEPGVMTNAEYKSPFVSSGSDPQYIQDILFYLEASWTAYKAANLEVPNSRINVFVDPLPAGTDGVTSFTGKITINQKMTGSSYATIEENLPMVCAHELLHYVQDYYYVQLFADYATKWWLEATATQADRIVWPKNTKFESLDPGLDLSLNLVNSWDNCLADPNWYIAGKFLCYMANYRTGTKMSLPEIIKDCGKATNVSYYRTIVDSYIKTKLGAAGIGDEFRDFVKYAFDAKGDLKYPAEARPAITPALPNQNNSILRTSYDVSTKDISVPYLAAGFLKCANYIGEKQNVFARLDKKSPEVDVFAYKSTLAGSRTFIQQMNEKDSIKVALADNNEWIDLLVINKTTTASGSAKATFRCEKLPFISSISPLKAKNGAEITISGSWFGSKVATSDIYFNTIKVNALSPDVKSWSENQIVVKIPIDATTGAISIKTKDASSNGVDYEIGKFVDFAATFLYLGVTYIDQSNNSTSKYEIPYFTNMIPDTIKKITWNGNTFSYDVYLPKSRLSIYNRTITATGTLSADQNTLLNFSYKQSGVFSYRYTSPEGIVDTQDKSYVSEFTVENVPRTSADGSPQMVFKVKGAAINNLVYKYNYSQTFKYSSTTNGYKEYTETYKSTDNYVKSDSEFYLVLQ